MAKQKTAENGTEPAGKLCAVGLPMVKPEEGCFLSRHVETQLDATQAATLASLRNGLDAGHHRLLNGRPVTTSAEAVRWVLEQICLGTIVMVQDATP